MYEFAYVKRCQNCGTINPKSANKCSGCYLLLVKEIELEELPVDFEE